MAKVVGEFVDEYLVARLHVAVDDAFPGAVMMTHRQTEGVVGCRVSQRLCRGMYQVTAATGANDARVFHETVAGLALKIDHLVVHRRHGVDVGSTEP